MDNREGQAPAQRQEQVKAGETFPPSAATGCTLFQAFSHVGFHEDKGSSKRAAWFNPEPQTRSTCSASSTLSARFSPPSSAPETLPRGRLLLLRLPPLRRSPTDGRCLAPVSNGAHLRSG